MSNLNMMCSLEKKEILEAMIYTLTAKKNASRLDFKLNHYNLDEVY